jgi:hypothetical protein
VIIAINFDIIQISVARSGFQNNSFFLFRRLPPYTLAGFDLTTHNSAGGDEMTPTGQQLNVLAFCIAPWSRQRQIHGRKFRYLHEKEARLPSV